jgi:hypothetical protein
VFCSNKWVENKSIRGDQSLQMITILMTMLINIRGHKLEFIYSASCKESYKSSIHSNLPVCHSSTTNAYKEKIYIRTNKRIRGIKTSHQKKK